MPRGPSARRYAQAVFQIARENDEQEEWLEDLRLMSEAVRDKEFAAFLEAPQVRLSDKLRAIGQVMATARPLARNLLSLLTSRRRADLVPAILEQYQALLDAHRGIERVGVVTAVPLEETQRQKIAQTLTMLVGKEIRLATQVEPGILGGMVARVGDRIIDGSTRTRLQDMRNSLLRAPT